MPSTRETFLDVRGLRLHLRERGAAAGATGPTTVLLHGWLDHCGSFDGLAPLLAAEGRVLALDLRGHGESGWVGAGGFYHAPEYVADLDGLLDALHLDGPIRLVGHSLGGAVALLYAAARPERVQHATLLDALPLTVHPEEVPARLTGYLDDLRRPRARRLVASVEEAADRLQRFSALLPREAALALARGNVAPDPAQGGALAWRWDPLLRGHSPLPFTEAALQALLPKIAAPVLLIRAEGGFVPEEPEVRSRLAPLRDLQILSLAGVSHHLHLERPAEVGAAILHAWRGQSSRLAAER